MVPTHESWLEDSRSRSREAANPLVMGLLDAARVLPESGFLHRRSHQREEVPCYAKDYAKQVLRPAKWGAFDTRARAIHRSLVATSRQTSSSLRL